MYIHEIFEAQARQTPDKMAVICSEQSLTYRELNARANQLAHYLKKLGVGPESILAICLGRCSDLVVAIFAVLKAGGASLLLDPGYPAERLTHMLEDSGADIVLTKKAFAPRLEDLFASRHSRGQRGVLARRIVCLDDSTVDISREGTEDLKSEIITGDLAFVLYTSGSTGTPKAVMWCYGERDSQKGWEAQTFQLTEHDCHLLRAPIGVTLLLAEVFIALLSGGQLIIVQTGLEQDPVYLAKLIARHEIAILTVVPSLLHALVEQSAFANCISLREVCTFGEVLTDSLKRRFFLCSEARLSVIFGATEAPGVTFDRCERAPQEGVVRLGTPLLGKEIYLLNHNFQRVEVGESGEICVGGGLSRGYLKRSDLTAEKFIPHPFSVQPGARLYRTGDLGRYLPDGTVEFIGRLDDQLNLHGFRIEPGEIEKAICEHPAISQSAVRMRDDRFGEARLIAYITVKTSGAPTSGALRRYLESKLPDHMIPGRFVTLSSMPLTSGGKLDRRALPELDGIRPELDTAYIAASLPVESELANIWAEVLAIDRVGIHDNFFELGGHSLLATRVILKLQNRFQIDISLRSFIKIPTVAGLSLFITRSLVENTLSEGELNILDELDEMSDEEANKILEAGMPKQE